MLLSIRIACCSGLGSREIPALGSCDLVECLRVLLWVPSHSQTPYILCKGFTLSSSRIPSCQFRDQPLQHF
jgi:hypothetical protein